MTQAYDLYQFNHNHHSGFQDAKRLHLWGMGIVVILMFVGIPTAYFIGLDTKDFVALLVSLSAASAGIYGGHC